MASYQSIPDVSNEYVSPINIGLLNQALSVNQQKYDSGLQSYQNNLAQLKVQENLLLREEDRERFSQNVQGLINEINKNGKVNWSKAGLTNKINTYTSQAIDDYTLEQIGVSQNIRKFEAEVSEKRKSKPELYDDKNYVDAKERAGVDQYMKGVDANGNRVDRIGDLRYNDYVDVKGTISKETEDYVSKFLLAPQYLGTDQSNPYFYTDSYGNKVEKETVEKYVMSKLDQKALNQLKIEARQTIGKLDTENYNRYLGEFYTNYNSEQEGRIAKTEAYLRSHPDEKAKYSPNIERLKKEISDNTLKIKNNSFGENDKYTAYTQNIVKEIAAPFEMSRITKIDRDKLPFEIMKAERDYQLDIAKFELSKERLKLDKVKADKEVKDTGASTGTETFIPEVKEGKPTTALEDVQKATYRSLGALDAYLKEQNIDNYNDKSEKAQWEYKTSLDVSEGTVLGNNKTLQSLVNTFKYAQKSYANIVNTHDGELKNVVAKKYNEMVGSKGLNLNNLASSMPLTAGVLNGKKSFEELTESQKLGVVAEFADQNIKNLDTDRDVKEIYKKIILNNKYYISKNDPQAYNVIKNSARGEEKESVLSRVWGGVKAPISYLGQGLQEVGQATFGYNLDRILQGKEYADQQQEIFDQKQKRNFGNIAVQGINALTVFTPDLREDVNISDIQSRDLNNTGGVKIGFVTEFATLNSKLKISIDEQAKSYEKNSKYLKAFTYSTEDKSQKKVASELENIVVTEGGTPIENNNYTVVKEGEKYKITYSQKVGKKIRRLPVYVDKLPQSVIGDYDTSIQEWVNSPLNPNVILTPKPVKPYYDANKRDNDVRIMAQNGLLDEKMESILLENPGKTPFATTSEIIENIISQKGQDFYMKNQDKINNILTADYQAIPFANPLKKSFQFKINYGEGLNTPAIDLGDVKDELQWNLLYRAKITEFKLSQINKL